MKKIIATTFFDAGAMRAIVSACGLVPNVKLAELIAHNVNR